MALISSLVLTIYVKLMAASRALQRSLLLSHGLIFFWLLRLTLVALVRLFFVPLYYDVLFCFVQRDILVRLILTFYVLFLLICLLFRIDLDKRD